MRISVGLMLPSGKSSPFRYKTEKNISFLLMLDILNSPVWILVGMVEVSAMTVLMLGILLDSAVGVLGGIGVGVL